MNLKNLKSEFKNKLFTEFYIELNSDYKDSIFLAGTGRSGTTWISSIINYNNEYRYIFEPFYSDRVSTVKNFRYRQYLRPDNQAKEFILPTKHILSGKVRSNWTDELKKRFISNKRLIKDIRANLLLSWIHNNFPSVPIILLLRHPCGVVNSHLKLGWDNHIEELIAVITGDSIVDSWRKHVTDEQLQRAIEIMSRFGLDKIYSKDAMPDPAGAYDLMRVS